MYSVWSNGGSSNTLHGIVYEVSDYWTATYLKTRDVLAKVALPARHSPVIFSFSANVR